MYYIATLREPQKWQMLLGLLEFEPFHTVRNPNASALSTRLNKQLVEISINN